jgi:hypothetical protein
MAFMEHLKAVAGVFKTAPASTNAKVTDAGEARRNWESLHVGTPESDAPPPAPTRADAVLKTTGQAWELTPEEIESIGSKNHPDDVFLWPDDAWCTREEWERGAMSHRSDDFIEIRADDKAWESLGDGEEFRYDDVVSLYLDRAGQDMESVQRAARKPAGLER